VVGEIKINSVMGEKKSFSMNISELEPLVKMLRANRVKFFNHLDIELEFHDRAFESEEEASAFTKALSDFNKPEEVDDDQ
jgi:hypothetical protein